MAQSAGARLHPRQSLRGEEGLDCGNLVAGPLCPAVPGPGTHPQRSIPLGMARKSPGNSPGGAAPPALPAEPPGTEPCRGACARHIPLTQKRVPREREICAGQLALSDSSSGSGNAARNLPRPRQPAASLLPRQRRTRGFVPMSPGMKHSSLPQPAPALPAARVTRPGDKGLPGTFSKSPWKALATPRPSPLSAQPGHPGVPRPLLPQPHQVQTDLG